MWEKLRRLGQETMIYGLSTVLGRMLNILLLPLYTHFLLPAEYGIVTTVFSYIAFLNVLYGYGMDVAFMRLCGPATPEGESTDLSTPFFAVAATSLAFSALLTLAAAPLTRALEIPPEMRDVVCAAAWILAFDAMALVPFAELRLSHRPAVYAGIKVAGMLMNVALNYVFLVVIPLGVKGVFLATLLTSIATLAMLTPVLVRKLERSFDAALLGSLLRFALPLVPAGLASMMVHVIDRPILQALTDNATVGVYQANYRLGVFMMMVVNMFDAAWRPFFLKNASDDKSKAVLARVLTYFTLGSAMIVLAISLFIGDIVALPIMAGKPLIHPSYWPGLSIVPVVLLGYLFNGIYVNMLAPATLAKRSDLIAYATGIGAFISVIANLVLIPRWGLMGAAAAALLAYAAMAAALFALTRSVYPIAYEYGRLAKLAACFALVAAAGLSPWGNAATASVAARAGLCLSFPALLALSGFFDAEERAALKSLLARLRSKTS